jgi:hypothetical protein
MSSCQIRQRFMIDSRGAKVYAANCFAERLPEMAGHFLQ